VRLVMMGTGPFAVPTFRGLYETHHEVVALVTRSLHPARGEKLPAATPMRDVAHEHGTLLYDPEDVNSAEAHARLSMFVADLFVVCDYGQILSAQTLALARLGGINLHASLLPKYRGAAPINWAIYDGERETGVTVIHMTPRVDAGPCIAQGRAEIMPDEDAVELEARLADVGAWMVRRAIDELEAGRLEALPQDPSLASKAPRLKKTDGAIDWSRPALAIKNHIRAFEPWPKCYTYWRRKQGAPVRMIVGPAQVVPGRDGAAPGTVLTAHGSQLIVAAGKDALALSTLQPAGKRTMGVEELLRGYRIQPGDQFGPEA